MIYNLFIFKKDYILLSIMNYSYCKKDFKNEVNNRFENYLNDRDVNKNILENNTLETSIKNETKNSENKNIEYNKDDFLDEIMRIHNDIYFNPYKILEISKDYTPESLKTQYKSMAMKYHPDKGGDSEVFKDITQSYLYLLKKYKENLPDKQIYDLKNEFDDFTKNEGNSKNILMPDSHFNLNQFNNIFNDNFTQKTNGYEDFLKNGTVENKTESDSYIFSDTFNINVFNKVFNTKIKKNKENTVIVYKEPETLFQSSNNFSELDGDDELEDYTSGFTFNYTDCKKAYSNPEDLSNIDVSSFNSIDDLEKHRSDISYKMSNEDLEKYNNYLKLEEIKQLQKQKKIDKKDLNILKKYKNFHNSMITND